MSRWTRMVLAGTAGLQMVAGSSDLAELLPPVAARWVQIVVGGIVAAVVVYTGRYPAVPVSAGKDVTQE